MNTIKRLFLLTYVLIHGMCGQMAHADYTTGKRIVAADITQGQKYVENYIKDSPPKAGVTKGWSCYADAAGTRPVDGTGGTATGVTFTATSTSPLKGPGAFVFTKTGAANKQGMGCSYNFSIDAQDKAKVLDIDLEYLVGSGTFTAGTSSTDSDVILYVYDVTNGTLIEPSSIKLLSNSTTLTDSLKASFQTASNSTSYRLIFHIATTTTNDFTLKFGDISVARTNATHGTPTSEMQTYTNNCSGSWTGLVTYTCKMRRVGDHAEFDILVQTSGAPTGTGLSINLPVTIDNNKLSAGFNFETTDGVVFDLGNASYLAGARYNTTTSVMPYYVVSSTASGQTSQVTASAPMAFGASDYVNIRFKVPVLGWGSSVQLSDQADTRVVAAKYGLTATHTGTGGTAIFWNKIAHDTHGAMNTANGRYTCPVGGLYKVHGIVQSANGVASNILVYRNGSAIADGVATTTYAGLMAVSTISPYTTMVSCNVGDYLTVVQDTTSNITTNSYVAIERISGPTRIAANETITMQAHLSSVSTVISGNTIIYNAKDWDSHGIYNTSNGRTTAPVSGTYLVSATTSFTGSAVSNWIGLYKNGALLQRLYFINNGAQEVQSGSIQIKLLAGDYIDVRPMTNAADFSGGSLDTGPCVLAVTKVANY